MRKMIFFLAGALLVWGVFLFLKPANLLIEIGIFSVMIFYALLVFLADKICQKDCFKMTKFILKQCFIALIGIVIVAFGILMAILFGDRKCCQKGN